MNKYNTTFLLPQTSFITWIKSIFDTNGDFFKFNTSESWKEADRKAIENDFWMVGEDLKYAMENFNPEE